SSLDWYPSWENSFASIARIRDEILLLSARIESRIVGLLVYYPALNWIMLLVVKKSHRRQGVATSLIKHLVNRNRRGRQSVKILDIEHSDMGMTAFLRQIGFVMYVNQFEMEFLI
ncbi:MAG: GNAT family N-acetyltransferase, partial [Candidatus Aminicenantes bacterium]|nr:GNAT family N-acetyltransferase [Candidatus Aminicenantes bacterium]